MRLTAIVLVALIALMSAEDASALPATYYHPSYAGGLTASGAQYNPGGFTAAMSDPAMLGEDVEVCLAEAPGACVTVTVTDTCSCGIDLSEAAFLALAGNLDAGVIDVAVY